MNDDLKPDRFADDFPLTEAVGTTADSDESVAAVLARLVESGKEYARAELDRQRLRAGLVGAAARDAAILIGIAITLVFASIVALLVGLITALSPLLSPIGATVAVVVGALIVAGLLVLGAKSRIGRVKKALEP